MAHPPKVHQKQAKPKPLSCHLYSFLYMLGYGWWQFFFSTSEVSWPTT